MEGMELFRITPGTIHLLGRLFPLYEEAFPEAERRTRGQLARMVARTGQMNFTAILMDPGSLEGHGADGAPPGTGGTFRGKAVCGLFSYWDFGSFLYLEHLATFPGLRNRHIGGKALSHVGRRYPVPQLLEVEPPTGGMASRRVAYYGRNGFRVLERDYRQPPYSRTPGGKDGIPMWIMGRGTEGDIGEKIETIRKKAYIEPLGWE